MPSDPPNVLGVQLDWRFVQFSLLAALGSCLFFGLAPAWQTARTDFVSALKAGGEGAAGKGRTFGRDVLVAGQMALAMVVLIAAGMFLAGFRNMLAMPPEFRTDRLISPDTAPAVLHYSPEQTKARGSPCRHIACNRAYHQQRQRNKNVHGGRRYAESGKARGARSVLPGVRRWS